MIFSQNFIRHVYNSETIYREAQNSVKVEQNVYNFDFFTWWIYNLVYALSNSFPFCCVISASVS